MARNATRYGVPREILQDRQGTIAPIQAGAIPRIQFSTGLAKVLQDFSRDMFAISSRIEDRLDDQAEAEATIEGATAGATGNFQTRDYMTIRNRAYNKAGIEAFVATLETRSIVKMQELSSRFATDPTQLQAEIDAYNNGVAQEIDRVSPGAGVVYRQRAMLRALPAIEQAKDNVYKLTRDQADAALIESEVALQAEIRQHATDLFSDNPARSQAAAQAIGLVQQQLMQVYNAVDPATGRPLYSAEERAKAKQKFYEDTMTSAALSWFDGQEDKASAYIKFTEGEFPISLDVAPANVEFIDATNGKIRNLPVKESLKNQIAAAAVATDPELSIKIVSGGQPGIGEGGRRTGSTRHDHGNAADIVLVKNGREIRPDQDKALYAKFLENAAAAGIPGIGHYAWGVHVGGGSVASWGPNTRSNSLDPVFAQAINKGRMAPRIQTEPSSTRVDLRQALPAKVLAGLEEEMRSRISFRNSIADRNERIADKQLAERQEAQAFELTNRMFNAGQRDPDTGEVIPELSRTEIATAVRLQQISPSQGQAILKALAVEPPARSDQDTYTEALRRVYAGENIYSFVMENASKLSPSDASELLGKNQTLNVSGAGSMSDEERFHFSNLQDLLTPDSMMAKIDPGAEQRKYFALDEYRQRIGEGESPRLVARDIAERATLDFETVTNTALDKMVRPRFYVPLQGKPGRVDIQASAKALHSAFQAGRISEPSYRRQVELLRQWSDTQRLIGE